MFGEEKGGIPSKPGFLSSGKRGASRRKKIIKKLQFGQLFANLDRLFVSDFIFKTADWHTGILLYPVFSGVVLLVLLIFFFRSGCSPFAR